MNTISLNHVQSCSTRYLLPADDLCLAIALFTLGKILYNPSMVFVGHEREDSEFQVSILGHISL